MKEFDMAMAFTWLNRAFTVRFWANMAIRSAFIAAGVYLAVAGYSPWLVVAYFWGMGALSLTVTWRPKPTTDYRLKDWKVKVGSVYLYTIQVFILGFYRLGQLLIDPLKLHLMAPELRTRPDIVMDEDAYFADLSKREWMVVRKRVGFNIQIKQVGSVIKLIFAIFGGGSWIRIRFDESHGLTPQQFRKLRGPIMSLEFIKDSWGGGTVTGDRPNVLYVECDFQLGRGIFALNNQQLSEIESAIGMARLYRGERQEDN